jgi:hypothetical protein
MKKIMEGLYFYLLLGILYFPLIIGFTNILEEHKLDGAVVVNKDTTATLSGWFKGSFQEIKEKRQNDVFLGHNFCVRLHNEIEYRLFKKVNANGVIIGKEGYLYEEAYILNYLGKTYAGADQIEKCVLKCKEAQEFLLSKGKTMIVVLAVGKGSFYSEYIPDRYLKLGKSITNDEDFAAKADINKFHFINFSTYFNKLKQTSPYILYPKYGIHWSHYAFTLVADSIVNYIEKERKVDIPNIRWNAVELLKAKDTDYDIGSGLNLLTYLDGPEMGYPGVWFEDKSQKDSVNLLVISDSFYWGIFNMGFSNLFAKSDFWFYNKDVHPTSTNRETTDKLDFKKEIDDHDVFILMATESNIDRIGWGFLDKIIELKHSKN